MAPSLQIKRIYQKSSRTDGTRILVDRIWPRGVSKKKAALDAWCKEIAPTSRLRKWFGHDPERFKEFRRRYRAELKSNKVSVAHLKALAKKGRVTLVYAAHDEEHNHARVLAEYLNGRRK
jgi:uncharacterized protein YeaO (DUF488 family)